MDELGKVKRVIEKQAPVDRGAARPRRHHRPERPDPGPGVRRGRRRHRHRAHQARRLRQGRHRGRRSSASSASRSSWSASARAPTTWRRSTPRRSSTPCSETELRPRTAAGRRPRAVRASGRGTENGPGAAGDLAVRAGRRRAWLGPVRGVSPGQLGGWARVPMGMTSGVPATGSSMTLASRSKTSASSSSVRTSAGVPDGDDPAVAHGDQAVGVAGGEVQVVQDHDDRGPRSRVELRTRSRTSIWWARSRKVVGSSSSSRSVPWASAIAIHTRWRCPPDSSSTAGRPAPAGRSWPAPRRPPPRRRATTAGRASGAGAGRGRRGRRRSCPRARWATAAAGPGSWRPPCSASCGCLAVEQHPPPDGLSSRARARSSVDLPQALGPTIVVTVRPRCRGRDRRR